MARLINGDSVTEISNEAAEALLNAWNKGMYISEVSHLHDELFNSILAQYNYTSFAELNSWAQEPINQYDEEAKAIKSWYRETWLLIEQYAEAVTEQTAMSAEAFIETLPAFTFGE